MESVSAENTPNAGSALIVESDLLSREMVARVLRGRGWDVQSVVCFQQGEAVLMEKEARFDLLIIDFDISTEGLELLRLLATMDIGRRPRRIVVVADELAAIHPRLSELQLELEVFEKPVTAGRLV